MVYPPMNVVLLSFVALRGLVVVPRLLLLLLLLRSLPLPTGVGLSWSVLGIIGAMARIVTMSTTPETHDDPSRGCVIVPHRSACRGVLAVLLRGGALS